MGEHRVAWMNASEPRITKDLLEAAALEDPESARHLQREVHDLPRVLDSVVLGGKNFGGPERAVIDAVGPILRDAFEVWLDGVERELHLGDSMLNLGVVNHRSRQGDGSLGLERLHRQIQGATRQPEID